MLVAAVFGWIIKTGARVLQKARSSSLNRMIASSRYTKSVYVQVNLLRIGNSLQHLIRVLQNVIGVIQEYQVRNFCVMTEK